MKVAKKLRITSIENQIKNLKRRVYIQHPDFQYHEGIIISLEIRKKYWIWLDNAYQKKDGEWSRKKEFDKEYIRLI